MFVLVIGIVMVVIPWCQVGAPAQILSIQTIQILYAVSRRQGLLVKDVCLVASDLHVEVIIAPLVTPRLPQFSHYTKPLLKRQLFEAN